MILFHDGRFLTLTLKNTFEWFTVGYLAACDSYFRLKCIVQYSVGQAKNNRITKTKLSTRKISSQAYDILSSDHFPCQSLQYFLNLILKTNHWITPYSRSNISLSILHRLRFHNAEVNLFSQASNNSWICADKHNKKISSLKSRSITLIKLKHQFYCSSNKYFCCTIQIAWFWWMVFDVCIHICIHCNVCARAPKAEAERRER